MSIIKFFSALYVQLYYTGASLKGLPPVIWWLNLPLTIIFLAILSDSIVNFHKEKIWITLISLAMLYINFAVFTIVPGMVLKKWITIPEDFQPTDVSIRRYWKSGVVGAIVAMIMSK